jgi:hypothetical protein
MAIPHDGRRCDGRLNQAREASPISRNADPPCGSVNTTLTSVASALSHQRLSEARLVVRYTPALADRFNASRAGTHSFRAYLTVARSCCVG